VQGSLRANNGDALREAVLADLGIALLPTFLCGDDIRRGRVQCLLDGWCPEEIYVNAVHPPGRHVAAKVRRSWISSSSASVRSRPGMHG
jgi:DNA-binding transcriptional LysR family regulator